MIKRPFVWLFGAYFVGLLLAWYRFPGPFLLLLCLIHVLLINLLMYQIKVGCINRKDGFLWCMPLLMLLGFLIMGQRLNPTEADRALAIGPEVTLTGEITMIRERASGRTLYTRDNIITLAGGDSYPVERIMIYTADQNSYQVGNKLQASGRISSFLKPSNPGQFNERMYYKIQNIDYKMKAKEIIITNHSSSSFHTWLGKLRQRLTSVYADILSEREAGVITAMLLGEKYLLEEELNQLYQDNGIAHILAISGLHITIIGYTLYQLLMKCRFGLLPSAVLSLLVVYGYGLMTDFSVSTNRAVVMFTVLLFAKLFGKTYDSISALALCAFLILLKNPLQLFSPGFLLSFGAVFGISVLLPCLQQLFPFKSKICYGLLASISAQLMTLPLLMCFFYQLPVYSVIINLLILPTMTVLMLSAIAAGIAGLFCMSLGVFLIGGASILLKYYEAICRLGSSLPGNLYTTGKPGAIRIIVYLLLLICFLWAVGKHQWRRLILLPVLAVTVLLIPVRSTGLSVTMLEVGQGEAIFMKNETGTTYLIDGGSSDLGRVGTYRLSPYLLSIGEACIDYALVTHADEDHISGLKELMEGGRIQIKHLVLPGIEVLSRSLMTSDQLTKDKEMREYGRRDEAVERENYGQKGVYSDHSHPVTGLPKDRLSAEEAYLNLEQLANSLGIKVLYFNAGAEIVDGDLRIECLHPVRGYQFTSSNSYSMVLSVSYGAFDLLLTGDLERNGESLVMERLVSGSGVAGDKSIRDYDVLKVAHHGSKNSTGDEFLQIIKPEYALISCAQDNRYGHPHKELIDRLYQHGARILITNEYGAITIWTDGERMEVKSYLTK